MPHDMDCEIYRVVDASGGSMMDGHKYAIDRMVQVGVAPVTWSQVLLVQRTRWSASFRRHHGGWRCLILGSGVGLES